MKHINANFLSCLSDPESTYIILIFKFTMLCLQTTHNNDEHTKRIVYIIAQKKELIGLQKDNLLTC